MRAIVFLVGVVLGVLALGAARFVALPEPEHDEPIHYHANFALYVDGERVHFQDPRYMEDIASCRLDPALVSPRDRVHMHQMIDDVVHVHAGGVAWSHFFANLGYLLGDDVLYDDSGEAHATGDGRQLTFILNGQRAPAIANQEVRSLDRLLLYHGPADVSADSIQGLFDRVADNAAAFNESHLDGPGCTTEQHGPETTADRLRRAFWF